MKDTGRKREELQALRELAEQLRDVLSEGRELDRVGTLLHEGWLHKRDLTGGITNPTIDDCYDRAREAGALGGKILGAGGGGFLLLYVDGARQEAVRTALADLRPVQFGFEPQGSKIIFVGDLR